MAVLPEVVYHQVDKEGSSLFIALRWMQRPDRVMVRLTENIQACLRIFRRAQHQWLVRDILHQPQGVFAVFVLWPHIALCCLERLRRTDDVTTILTGHDATHSALLPGGQYHE